MSNIDNLKDLLNGRFSDGRLKLPCIPNPKKTPQKSISIFEDPEFGSNEFFAVGTQSAYNQTVQIAIRHPDRSKARQIAFETFEWIGNNRNPRAQMSLWPMNAPVQAGIDEQGGYVWTFETKIQGDR